jgi:hypothetical protein
MNINIKGMKLFEATVEQIKAVSKIVNIDMQFH